MGFTCAVRSAHSGSSQSVVASIVQPSCPIELDDEPRLANAAQAPAERVRGRVAEQHDAELRRLEDGLERRSAAAERALGLHACCLGSSGAARATVPRTTIRMASVTTAGTT